MAAGRDPIDRLVDVMVAAPICTYVAARRTVPLISRAVRDRLLPAAEMVTETITESSTESITESATQAATETIAETGAVDTVTSATADRGDADPTVEPVSPDVLPIDDYDHLAARQVVDRLDGLTADELAAVDRYEREHRHRQTVLRKIEQLRP